MMNYKEIINSRFSEPAAILSVIGDEIKIIEVNDRFLPELWMNVSKEDYIKTFPQCCLDEDNLEVYLQAIKTCIASGKEQTIETWRLAFSDCCGFDKVCMKSRLILVEKSADEAIVYEGIRNISNEKRTQNTLKDIEYRYKNASEQINIYNWEYDISTKEMRPCYRCMRDLGLPALVTNYPEPAIDMGIFPPDYADMYRDMMRRIDAGESPLEADIPLTVGRIPFRVKYTTEFDENGTPLKAFGSATLISETELGRIKLDNQIIGKLAEEYSCIYLADFETDTVKTVKNEDLLSVPKNCDCGTLAELVASKIQRSATESSGLFSDVSALRTKLFLDCDRREFVYRDDANDRWITIVYFVIERENDTVNRMLVTASVVDNYRAQKMNADRLIAKQKDELEERQEMLLKSIDVANKANNAKTEFFSNMSHDIRTPMHAITGFSRLALDEIDSRQNVVDYLEKITSAGEHLMSLINDILDMSQIESGKMELTPEPVSIKKLLMGCADMMRVKMKEEKLRFFVITEEVGDDLVMCDKLRFNQIILNLLSNAYKYTREGGSVFLQGKLIDRNKKLTYEIRVRDTGIGMSEEFCKHIWDAFSREETAIVHETQGTGLGMVIVRNLVNLMNGTIDLNSEQGKGSEFIIVLPLEPAADAAGNAGIETAKANALSGDYSGYTILVVDDTEINLVLAKRMLEKYGFTIRTATSGVEAVQLISESNSGDIDLILMDVMMPVMNGLEAAEKIRALEDPSLASIPIIALTANAFESDVKKALNSGMNDYISKPYRQEDIVALIDKNLNN